jgi:hypothetical protein
MAVLTFTIDEAMGILRANGLPGKPIRDVKAGRDGLLVTVAGGIEIAVRPESFAAGVLRLSYSSTSWAFKVADTLGKVGSTIDDALRPYPFLRREGKAIFIDLDRALQTKVRGVRIRQFELKEGSVRIEF